MRSEYTHDPKGILRQHTTPWVLVAGRYIEIQVLLYEMIGEKSSTYGSTWAVSIITPSGVEVWACWGCDEQVARNTFDIEKKFAQQHLETMEEKIG